VQGISSIWFDQVRPALEAASLPAGFIASGTDVFDRLLREAKKRKPMKAALAAPVAEGLSLYRDLIHDIEVSSFATPSSLSIAPYVEGLPTDEGEYLAEAQRCLDANALRGMYRVGLVCDDCTNTGQACRDRI
jgi:hypothetical protein